MNKNIKEYLIIFAFLSIPTIYTILIILYWKYDW